MSIAKLPPVQFNFRQFWFHEFAKLRDTPPFREVLEDLASKRVERHEEFQYEDHAAHDPEQALLEYELVKIESPIRVRDLDWLVGQFDCVDLMDLMVLIAQTKYPDRKWIEIENDERMVVTDEARPEVCRLSTNSARSEPANYQQT